MMACFPTPEAQLEFSEVTLAVIKLTWSKRVVVEGLYEVPKPQQVSPKSFLTINELTASLGRR